MAAAPTFKIYDSANTYQAAAKTLDLAKAAAAHLGPGATVRNGHRTRHIVHTYQLPPAHEPTPQEHASRAMRVLQSEKAYTETLTDGDDRPEATATAISDLLADLMHLHAQECPQHPWHDILHSANNNHTDETWEADQC